MKHQQILSLAQVPEHSPAFMEAMSGGQCFIEDGYVFFRSPKLAQEFSENVSSDEVWLMAIGYPLLSADTARALPCSVPGDHMPHQRATFEAALGKAINLTQPKECFSVAPAPPIRSQAEQNRDASDGSNLLQDEDSYYILKSAAPTPPHLRGPVAKAGQALEVRAEKAFGPAHRRLWAEFLGRVSMKANVRRLYTGTEAALRHPEIQLCLLGAYTTDGQLCACLLLDEAPHAFTSYILGAHSRQSYHAHATDLLFRAMLDRAAEQGKTYVHLGLGVNEGILRFKRKWGAWAALPYSMSVWQEGEARGKGLDMQTFLLASMGSDGPSKWKYILQQPEQRPYAMLWEVEKQGKISWLGGTAHFFCYSFERAFRRLFDQAHTVIFEGPLDSASLAEVQRRGCIAPPVGQRVIDFVQPEEVENLRRTLEGTWWERVWHPSPSTMPDINYLLTSTRPWYAFFSLWTAFLERRGWGQSVDLEAWNLAQDRGKVVLGMEDLDEQVASLECAPMDRIVRFVQNSSQWNGYMRRNVQAYLSGDLTGMMGTSTEFPSRTEQIIDARDERFRRRMQPFLEQGGVVVFVGAAHMLRLRHMLAEDGFQVRQVLPTWKHRLAASWKNWRKKENKA